MRRQSYEMLFTTQKLVGRSKSDFLSGEGRGDSIRFDFDEDGWVHLPGGHGPVAWGQLQGKGGEGEWRRS